MTNHTTGSAAGIDLAALIQRLRAQARSPFGPEGFALLDEAADALARATPQPEPAPTFSEVQAEEAKLYRDLTGDAMALGFDGIVAALAALRATPQPSADRAPVDMILHCPACGLQHIDAAEEIPNRPIFKFAPTEAYPHKMVQVGTYTAQGAWTNPPHRSHLCHGCGHIWRPADVPTNGVRAIKTKGQNDGADRAPADGAGDVCHAFTSNDVVFNKSVNLIINAPTAGDSATPTPRVVDVEEALERYGTGVLPWSCRIPPNQPATIIADAMQAELNDLRPLVAAARATQQNPGCSYPLCKSEGEQTKIAAEIHQQLYSGEVEPTPLAKDSWKPFADKAVEILQRHAPPDGLSDKDALTELYEVFDGPEFRKMGTVPQIQCDARQAQAIGAAKEIDKLSTVGATPQHSVAEQAAVAWANWKVGTDSYVPFKTRNEAEASVRRSDIAATQEGPYEVVPLSHVRTRPLSSTAATQPEQASEPRLEPGHCHKCGLPLVDNPHPKAGKPGHYLDVGCPKECLPCTVGSRHKWAGRAMKAEGQLAALAIPASTAQEPADWRGFIESCAQASGGMVNGNRLAMQAKALLASTAASEQQAGADERALTDEQIIEALHGQGIDTYPSKYGFDAAQVSATSVPNLRKVIEKCAAVTHRATTATSKDVQTTSKTAADRQGDTASASEPQCWSEEVRCKDCGRTGWHICRYRAPSQDAAQAQAGDDAATPIPAGVYYDARFNNFYDGSEQGMGTNFYRNWKARHAEFPQSVAAMAAPSTSGGENA